MAAATPIARPPTRRGACKVPPGSSSYTLRRVWLTPEEEDGYYYGLANSAIWPLCHIAYARPEFNESDWEAYRRVNRRFAEAVLEEIGNGRGDRVRAGLSFRPAAALPQGRAARRDRLSVLAHSVAEP